MSTTSQQIEYAEFAEFARRAREQAWAEGYEAGQLDEYQGVTRPNPYTLAERTTEELHRVAHHEAGHIVATTMRGDSTFTGADITKTTEHDGITHMSLKPCDIPFNSYAGPWAEARADWGDRPLDDLDPEGLTFSDYVGGAFLDGGRADAEAMRLHDDLAAMRGEDSDAWHELTATDEQTWTHELEQMWPVVQAVAEHLIEHRTLTPAELHNIVTDHEEADQ